MTSAPSLSPRRIWSTSWGIPRSALGPVLTASNIGVLFGSQLLGLGRRPLRPQDRADHAPICCSASLTFAAAYSTDLTELFWLRFFAGFGIGGVIPNLVAINAELAPRKLRATLRDHRGGLRADGRRACAGFVSAALVPHYGWQILFQIGGVVPIVIRACRCHRPAGIDQIHGAARKPAAKNGAADRRDPSRSQGARQTRALSSRTSSRRRSSNPIYLFRNGCG